MKQKKNLDIKKIDWVNRLEVKDKERKEILKKAKEIIKKWELKMSNSFLPLVLDFGYNDFKNIGHIEYLIANEIKEGYCGKFIFMFSGQRCPEHFHKKKHETFLVLKGKVLMEVDGKKIILKEGDVLPMDRNISHTFKALKNSLIIEVSQPSIKNDNFFKDKKIGVI
ncbi:MAG: cupin domain-containing protein [bacterium]|nr:cupin domain-containing protein [bacterium]MCX7917339.1 cupin domain-containing protein [bacterium]MDW8164369.1 cupin domain-containing protein [Candidatus Omnitrophota bacterium]